MNSISYYTRLLLTSVLLTSCDKIDFGEDSGITEKSAENVPNGHIDDSDWSVDARWNKQEINLFKDLPFDLNSPQSNSIKNPSFTFYPNPVKKFVNFGYRLQLGDKQSVRPLLHFVVVNKSYKVIQEGIIRPETRSLPRATGFSEFALSLDAPELKKGKTYRMYYVLSDDGLTKEFLCKGHGDIEMAD